LFAGGNSIGHRAVYAWTAELLVHSAVAVPIIWSNFCL